MNKGLSIFNLARETIKGWFPTSKGMENACIPFIGTNEEKFLYYAEYNPEILTIERADIGEDFSQKYNIHRSVLIPIIIPYEWNGKSYKYFPDFLLTLKSGEVIVVEVGSIEEKEKEKSLSKAMAAIDYCKNRGWEYWLIVSNNILTEKRKNNYTNLKSFDKPMYIKQEIQNKISSLFKTNNLELTINYFINDLCQLYTVEEIVMSLMELMNHAAKEGRLVFDFDNNEITKESSFKILEEAELSIVPKRINVPYEQIIEKFNNSLGPDEETQEESTKITCFDVEQLPSDKKEEFFRKRAAVLEAISFKREGSMKNIAQKYDLKRSSLYRFIDNYIKYGDSSLFPYSSYNGRQSFIREEVKGIIKKIATKRRDWGAMQIFESDELKKAVISLSKQKNELISIPSYHQIYRYLKNLNEEDDAFPLTPRERSKKGKVSTLGAWVRSISSYMDHVQVDAHWLDIKIVTQDKQNIAGKLWAVVLIDVKTAMIVGYSLSLKAPMEEDYMMALKVCIESKYKITSQYNCENSWPGSGIPRRILSDNGKIFVSKRATDVLVKRFGIIEEIAPPYVPDIKGSIEALFTWVVNRLTSRLPGFTKNRDPKEVNKEALQTGITFEDFEELFVKAIVDGYNQEWDDLRGHTRFNLWIAEERDKGSLVPTWLGSKDELKLLLMKEEQNRKVDRHGISFLGRYYQQKSMLNALLNQHVSIRYDKRDISVIYVYLQDGRYFCEAYCQELMGKRRSVWEDQILRREKKAQKKFYNLKARANTNNNISNVKNKKPKKLKEKEAQFIEQARIFDKQDIHTENVNEVLSSTRIKNIGKEAIEPQAFNITEFSFKKPKIRRI
ncbi:MAG: Mu transposase C-terminal domain-containing protein [Deltaproteobacteria bacterium]